ncbi:ATP-binding protein [Streptomyces sp. NPDC018031]|uniref:ATP-binding protein n=1 Tax=Streptomyces sp. NPDC018031 TaxID=3365033 RepID=UPI003791E8AC
MQVLQVQMEVRPDPAEVGRARRWARSRLVGSGIDADEPLAETLILLISELVTNAVVHTGCPAVLRMVLPGRVEGPEAEEGPEGPAWSAAAPGRAGATAGQVATRPGGGTVKGAPGTARAAVGTVRVEVADSSARAPRQRHADEAATSGRGLELVDGLADRWGWQREGAGKRIWCEVDRCAPLRMAAFEPTTPTLTSQA